FTRSSLTDGVRPCWLVRIGSIEIGTVVIGFGGTSIRRCHSGGASYSVIRNGRPLFRVAGSIWLALLRDMRHVVIDIINVVKNASRSQRALAASLAASIQILDCLFGQAGVGGMHTEVGALSDGHGCVVIREVSVCTARQRSGLRP